MSRHFAAITRVATVVDALQHCLAADDCLRISYAGSDTVAASVSRVAADGRTVAMVPITALQDMLCGVAPATLVMTATGARPASALAAGDCVITAEGHAADVVAVRERHLGWRELGINPFLRPIRIAEGALGNSCPAEALVVAPGQLVPDGEGDRATMLPAHALLGRVGVSRLAVRSATYVELVLSDGAATLFPVAISSGHRAPGIQACSA